MAAENAPTIEISDTQVADWEDAQGQPEPEQLVEPNPEDQTPLPDTAVDQEVPGHQRDQEPVDETEDTPADKKSDGNQDGQTPVEHKGDENQDEHNLGDKKLDGNQGDKDPDAEPGPLVEVAGGVVHPNFATQMAQLSEDFDDFANSVFCKKCGIECDLTDCIIRGPKEVWCKPCNAVYVMLQRNLAWPPKEFACLDEDRQQQFFQQVTAEKVASQKSQFSYQRVRDTLCKCLVDERIRQKKTEVGGVYLPLSVYKKRGYELDEDFVLRNPRQFSYGLNCWTYLLAEVSISEGELKNTIERSVLECEKAVKKRKHAPTENESTAMENESTVADALMVMDLVTESEDEGHFAVGLFLRSFLFILRPIGPLILC